MNVTEYSNLCEEGNVNLLRDTSVHVHTNLLYKRLTVVTPTKESDLLDFGKIRTLLQM